MGVRQTWTDRDEAGDYVVPNVLSLRDLVLRPDRMDETVPPPPHTHTHSKNLLLSLRKVGIEDKVRINVFFLFFIISVHCQFI